MIEIVIWVSPTDIGDLETGSFDESLDWHAKLAFDKMLFEQSSGLVACGVFLFTPFFKRWFSLRTISCFNRLYSSCWLCGRNCERALDMTTSLFSTVCRADLSNESIDGPMESLIQDSSPS